MIKEDGRIYWAITLLNGIAILIPKQKGKGFVKTPIGHYHNKLSNFLLELGYDADGLDGYVNIATSTEKENMKDIEKLIESLAVFYNTTAVKVSFEDILSACLSARKR